MKSKKEQVISLFNERYNCAQALFSVYSRDLDIDRETAMKLTSGFGGGIAGLGKTCGAINAAIMIIGLKYGNTDKKEVEKKIKTKEVTRNFIKEFNNNHVQIECSALLLEDKDKRHTMHSEKCVSVIEEICDLLDQYI